MTYVEPISRVDGADGADLAAALSHRPLSEIQPSIGTAPKKVPSIEPATAVRPILQPPDDSPPLTKQEHEIRLQEFAQHIVNFLTILTDIQELYISRMEADMKESHVTMQKRMATHMIDQRDIENGMDAASWWDSVRNVSVCLLAASSMVLGGAIITSAATAFELAAGYGLLTSGAMSVAANTLMDSNTHPDAALALTLVGSAIGVAAGTASLMITTQSFAKLASELLVASVSISSSIATMSKEDWLRVTENLKAKNALSQNEIQQIQYLMDLMNHEGKNFIETLSRCEEEVTKLTLRHQISLKEIIAQMGQGSAA